MLEGYVSSKRALKKRITRSNILRAAIRLFQTNGVSSTGVDSLVGAAGLTAGCFYAHFESKNALLVETLVEAFAQSRVRLMANLTGSPDEAISLFRSSYISKWHRDNAADGCPLTGVAAELGRNGPAAKDATELYLECLIGDFEKCGVSRRRALSEIAFAAGTVMLSRVVSRGLGNELLASRSGWTSATVGSKPPRVR